MAETKVTETTVETTETVQPAKGFWDRFSKPIIYIGSAIIVLVGAWYGYKKFIVEPKEREANEQLFAAESLFDKMGTIGFNKDSVNIVMNGGDLEGQKITGVLKVISNFGGTKAGDRARYIAGASYLQIKEFDKAIKYLKEFDGNGATQIQSNAFVMLGHAYAEQKKTADALSAYKKAASVNDKDEVFASNALLIAAAYAQTINNNKEAIDLYEKVKEKYPSTNAVQNGDVDKNLARLGVIK